MSGQNGFIRDVFLFFLLPLFLPLLLLPPFLPLPPLPPLHPRLRRIEPSECRGGNLTLHEGEREVALWVAAICLPLLVPVLPLRRARYTGSLRTPLQAPEALPTVCLPSLPPRHRTPAAS